MSETEIKTIISYLQKGKKKAKQYNAIVVEAFKDKYIKVEIEVDDNSVFPITLKWNSFVYTATFFDNEVSCLYKVERNFTVKKVATESGQPAIIVKRKQSGKPQSQQ